MKKIISIVALFALIALVVLRLVSNKKTTETRVYKYDKSQSINVEAITLKKESVMNEKVYTGTFEPNKETKVSSDIQGKIHSVFVDAGSIVKKGQALLQLDNSLLKLQLQAINIQIEGLESDVKRFTVLANADAIQGIQLEKAILALRSANVQRETLIEQINKTLITAPFNGVVIAKLTEEGAFAAPGIPLIQIIDIFNLRFTVNVTENELSYFKLNQLSNLIADAYPETLLSGKIIMSGSKANLGNSFPIQFFVKNTSDLKIKSGMFGKVNLKNETKDKAIIIPASSIIGSNTRPQVYKITGGKAILQDIIVSSRFGNKAIVSHGLSEGDVLIISGFVNLYNGANVNFL